MKRETLAICSANKQDNPNINYIIEVYENDVKFIKKQGTTAIVPHIKFHLNFIKN